MSGLCQWATPKMAAYIVRALSLRMRLDAGLKVTSDEVLASVLQHVSIEDVVCFTRVQRNNFQVTVKSPEAKESLMLEGIDVQSRHFPCYAVQREREQHLYTSVTILMPYEIPDQFVTDRLSQYCSEIVSSRRLTNKRHPSIETGVRLFTMKDADIDKLPSLIQVGIYNMVVRRCGAFVRRCYRCRSESHLIKDCPKPPSGFDDEHADPDDATMSASEFPDIDNTDHHEVISDMSTIWPTSCDPADDDDDSRNWHTSRSIVERDDENDKNDEAAEDGDGHIEHTTDECNDADGIRQASVEEVADSLSQSTSDLAAEELVPQDPTSEIHLDDVIPLAEWPASDRIRDPSNSKRPNTPDVPAVPVASPIANDHANSAVVRPATLVAPLPPRGRPGTRKYPAPSDRYRSCDRSPVVVDEEGRLMTRSLKNGKERWRRLRNDSVLRKEDSSGSGPSSSGDGPPATQ